MRKSLLIMLFIIKCFSPALSQNIDSLKNVLPTVYDTARIDCLNTLSLAYILTQKKDSAEYWATLAFAEAKRLTYVHGIAVSLLHQAWIAKHFDDDFKKSEALGKESLRWYERTGNKEGIDTLYNYLTYTVFSQSKFDEAIDYTKKRYANAKQNGNRLGMTDALSWMFAIYRQSGDYEKSFLFAQQRYDLALKAKNKIEISSALYSMAQLYELIEDYPNALTYFRKVLQMDDEQTRKDRVNTDNDIWFKMEFTEVFSHLNQFDSALHYYNLFKPVNDKAVYMRVYLVSAGECYFLQKDYPHALQNFLPGLDYHKKLNDRNEIQRTLLDIAKTYLAQQNYSAALKYGREGLSIALQTKARQFIRDGYQILYSVYNHLNQTDSAYFYYQKYIVMKEAVVSDQVKGKFAAYNYEQKIELLNKEKEVQQATLEKQSFLKKILIIGMIALVLLSIVIFRVIMLKRKNEAHLRAIAENELLIQKLESQKQLSELEMQALRAQMNPHFIFNCLNAINHFILSNEADIASDYLTKFSRLIRLVLQSSSQKYITLWDELETLKLYIGLEEVRFKKHFSYTIECDENADADSIMIPPMLIQPFVENAIWHGLMHKEEAGKLVIDIAREDDMLCCTITDNGIGRQKAAALKSKSAAQKKSMGMQITANRLQVLNGEKNNPAFLHIIDLKDEAGESNGTEVIIRIPIKIWESVTL